METPSAGLESFNCKSAKPEGREPKGNGDPQTARELKKTQATKPEGREPKGNGDGEF